MSTTTEPLTQEEKRVKIAKAIGWKEYPPEKEGLSNLWMNDATDLVLFTPTALPDYFGDLNAMHEAEKTISDEDFTEYHRKLYLVTKKPDMWQHNRAFISVSARDRAECFGRTLNLW